MSHRYTTPHLIARIWPAPQPRPRAQVLPLSRYSRRRDPTFQHMVGSWALAGVLTLLALLATRL
jgi:hypothetical protein